MKQEIGFTAAQWARVREDYAAWWSGELDRPLLWLFRDCESSQPSALTASAFLPNWPQDLKDDQIVEAAVRSVSGAQLYGDALPTFFVNYGPGIVAAFAGATVHPAPDTVWFEPAFSGDLSSLDIKLDRENVWWRRVCHVTELLSSRLGDRVQIGITDLGGGFDILAGLRGTDQLLMDLVECPGEVERCMRQVTALWLESYDAINALIAPHCAGCMSWAPTWAPSRTYMLQSDFSCMISAAMFKAFAVPDLEACCSRLDHTFYHLDGPGALTHLEALCAIPKLHGIQWIPGAGQPEASEWPQVLDKIRDAGKLVQVSATPQGAMDIVRRYGSKGFLIWLTPPPDITDTAARALLKDLNAARKG